MAAVTFTAGLGDVAALRTGERVVGAPPVALDRVYAAVLGSPGGICWERASSWSSSSRWSCFWPGDSGRRWWAVAAPLLLVALFAFLQFVWPYAGHRRHRSRSACLSCGCGAPARAAGARRNPSVRVEKVSGTTAPGKMRTRSGWARGQTSGVLGHAARRSVPVSASAVRRRARARALARHHIGKSIGWFALFHDPDSAAGRGSSPAQRRVWKIRASVPLAMLVIGACNLASLPLQKPDRPSLRGRSGLGRPDHDPRPRRGEGHLFVGFAGTSLLDPEPAVVGHALLDDILRRSRASSRAVAWRRLNP